VPTAVPLPSIVPAAPTAVLAPPTPIRLVTAIAAHPRLTVALAATVPFLVTLGNPPVLDDGWAALDNPLVWTLRNAGRIFRELYGYAGSPTVRGPYRPLATLSYALDHAVHGAWTPGFHAVNVALHAGASLLVLALARRLAGAAAPGRAARIALLAALLFALHPAHVEAVATIFGRPEPLATCLVLGALVLALDAGRARWRLPAAGVLLAAGMLAKEVAVVTPILYAVLARAVPCAAGLAARPGLRDGPARRALARAATVAAALALATLPYFLLRGVHVAVAPEARWFPVGTPPAHVALTMSRVLGEDLRILAFPGFLGGDFAYAARLPTLAAPTPGFAVATAAWVATLGAGLLLLRRAPLVGAGLVATFLPLLPVLQLVPVGVLIAERLLYLPSVGFCVAAAALLGGGDPRGRRGRATAALALVILATLLARTVVRTLDWRSERAFWESELAKAPGQVVVNNNLGLAYTAAGELDRARERFEVAIRLVPSYWRAHLNLGIVYARQGDVGDALRSFDAASALAPAEGSPRFFAGWALERAGYREEAVARYREAARLAPENRRTRLYLGRLLSRLGRGDEARVELRRAAALDPHDAEIRRELDRLGAR
jgi:protein O-mannosyl-transferase